MHYGCKSRRYVARGASLSVRAAIVCRRVNNSDHFGRHRCRRRCRRHRSRTQSISRAQQKTRAGYTIRNLHAGASDKVTDPVSPRDRLHRRCINIVATPQSEKKSLNDRSRPRVHLSAFSRVSVSRPSGHIN